MPYTVSRHRQSARTRSFLGNQDSRHFFEPAPRNHSLSPWPQKARRPLLPLLFLRPKNALSAPSLHSQDFSIALSPLTFYTAHGPLLFHRQESLHYSTTMSAEQAAAQAAVAAANTPQQQPHGTPQQSASTPASVVNSSGDQLVCQWQSCGERLPSAEQLYVSVLIHVRSDHGTTVRFARGLDRVATHRSFSQSTF
jgi:hypothetical protein